MRRFASTSHDDILLKQKRTSFYAEKSLYSKSLKVLRIYFSDETCFNCGKFSDAFSYRLNLRKIPIGFSLNIISGEINCSLNIHEENNLLEIDVSPEDSIAAGELFMALHQWADDYCAPKIPQTIGRIAESKLKFVTSYLMLFFVSAFLLVNIDPSSLVEKQKRLESLLVGGIDKGEVVEAITLLAQLQTNSYFPTWFPLYLFIAILIFIYLLVILLIRPRVILGIGKGDKKLKAWKWWQRFVLVLMPVSIVTVIIDIMIGLIDKSVITRFLNIWFR